MKNVILIVACLVALCTPTSVAAQTGNDKPKTAEQVQKEVAETQAIKQKIDEARIGPRFVMTLTNVQVELTLTDQLGSGVPEKKTVSMIVASGNWGKIRSVGTVRPAGEPPFGVDLNVDARPHVSVDGQIQLELTLNYSPPADKDSVRPRPTGINQSQTVVLQSGKPLTISQAADPLNDRKVIVEVKATVLK